MAKTKSASKKPQCTQTIFESGIEGAQHGAKSLEQFLDYAKAAGATGVQPSNFMLNDGKGGFRKAADILALFAERDMHLQGVSAHCPFWAHGAAWTGTKTSRPFMPPNVAKMSPGKMEAWHEKHLLGLMDLTAELRVKTMPMFWGPLFGWELATGYPWGFMSGDDYDLVEEGKERFVNKTAKLRAHANQLGLKLCHEPHPGTAGVCADDCLMLVDICDGDKSLAIIADPSHCCEGETWEVRFQKLAKLIYACHVKNHVVRPGLPLRSMQTDWKKRAMQFTDLTSGQINLPRFVEFLIEAGYPQRYCEINGTKKAPLVSEAESPYVELDRCSADAVDYINKKLCFPVAAGSFEDGMGS